MDLVVGATGYLGSTVCRALVDAGREVTALVRPGGDPAKREALQALGVQFAEGDVKDRASLDAACAGKSSVVSTASASISRQSGDSIQTVDLDGQKNLIDAAQANGVSQFVYISFSKNMDTDSPLVAAKRAVEAHLQASGVDYTILRCSFLMEIMLNPVVGFDYASGNVVVYGSGENPISFVSMGDVAKLVALSLTEPAARNAVVEFGGPEAPTIAEVVRTFEEVSGRSFTSQVVPEDALRGQMESATDDVSRSLAAIMVDYARGDVIDMQATLATFPLQLSSVRDYASRVTSAG